MATLLCFGFGYCAENFVADFGEKFDRVVGTVRSTERTVILNAYQPAAVRALVFDGVHAGPELKDIAADAERVLVSIPPGETGDPVLAACGEALAAARNLRTVVYLSTVGVYGDRGGDWVDEEAAAAPASDRSRWRLAAEQAWQHFGGRHGIPIAVLRLAGIYGPGQNALVQVARGTARRVAKPGQVFNRIHVSDIAQAIDAAFARRANGVFNIADDEPGPAADPILFAADLLGREPPPEIAFEQAASSMSPMGLSFWKECRRVRNDKLKRELGVALRYPTYREGLRALFAAIDASAGA
jgi:nucleoside-diphosphate-sugar epimerase